MEQETAGQGFLTGAIVSRYLGVTPAPVRQLADTGTLPCIRTATGMRLYRFEVVERLAHKRSAAQVPRREVAR